MNKLHFLEEMCREELDLGYDVPLSKYSTMRIGGAAQRVATPKTKDMLVELVKRASAENIEFRVSGFGSNIIFGNLDLLINTSDLRRILLPQEQDMEKLDTIPLGQPAYLELEAGFPLSGKNGLARLAERYSLKNAEFLVGIPGTIGGMAVMNAGVGSVDSARIIRDVNLIAPDGQILVLNHGELGFSHRFSRLQTDYKGFVVYSVKVQLEKAEQHSISENTQKYLDKRYEQPTGPSIGSLWVRRGYIREDQRDIPSPTQYDADDVLGNAHCGGIASSSGRLFVPNDGRFISYVVAQRVDGL
ncbi:MAG: FAD-binding protein, partial [Candidatus Woesearchaeota archaeon]